MTTTRRLAPALVLCLFADAAIAVEPCYSEPGTRAMTCINSAAIRSNGDLRSSPVYTGGPKGVEQTTYTIIADCKRKVTTLQDRRGVNFGGGAFDATKANMALSTWLCEAKKTKQDNSLQQF